MELFNTSLFAKMTEIYEQKPVFIKEGDEEKTQNASTLNKRINTFIRLLLDKNG